MKDKFLKTILNTPQSKSDLTKGSRRDFIQKAGMGGLALGLMFNGDVGREVEYTSQKVNRNSAPTDLKITDLRIAYTSEAPIIKDRYQSGNIRTWRSKGWWKSEICFIPKKQTFGQKSMQC